MQNERTKLLCHPLVTYLLRHKWRTLGRYFYYSKLFLYIIYLFFLTGYALNVITDKYTCLSPNTTSNTINTTFNQQTLKPFKQHGDCICVQVINLAYENKPSAASRRFFVGFGKNAILFLTICSLIIEVSAKIYFIYKIFFVCFLDML